MAAFSGSALNLSWVWSGGTVALAGDFRNFEWTPSLSLIETSAGADTFREFISSIGEAGALSYTAVMQSGGTALIAALASGNAGTLVYSPSGTATGQPKSTIPAISRGVGYTQPYNEVVEMKVEWQQSAAHTQAAW